MGALQWDQAEQKFYHSGVSKVILFPNWNVNLKTYTGGVAWNGVTSIEESPDGGEANDIWADNVKYGSMRAVENLKGSISAYQWPDALNALDGKLVIDGIAILGQQKRTKRFGLCYRTEIGTEGNPNAGYQLHFLYDMMISPSEKSYETTNDSPDATEFSWDFECLPQKQTANVITGYRPVHPGESVLYEGENGKLGYEYRHYGGQIPVYTENASWAALSSLIPANGDYYFAVCKAIDPADESFIIYDVSRITYSVEPFGEDGTNPVPEGEGVVNRYSAPVPSGDGDRYVPIDKVSFGSYDEDVKYYGINVKLDNQSALRNFELCVRLYKANHVFHQYAYSSVTLDSRSTSAEKMNAISNMIYNSENRMPTLSELLG